MVRTAEHVLAKHITYLKKSEQKDVLHALHKAEEWHEGQFRATGEPYVMHPIAVATYLTSLEAGRDTLIAALLHDVVEDNRAPIQAVQELFGEKVADLVDGVTKLSKIKYEGRRSERQLASLRKMLLSAHEDLRVIFIKLADRWHNAQSLADLPTEKQERIAKETLDIYVPFARLVGLWQLKAELEEACFPLAYPEEFEQWHSAIENVRKNIRKERKDFVKRINAETTSEVTAEVDTMTDYEVYKKFQGNIARIQETRSLDTVHITVHSEDNIGQVRCYELLGEIHMQYPVLMGSFKDYISAPQANGYMALHTTIFLSKNHLARLRIQTREMHEFSASRKLPDWVVDPEGNLQAALGALQQGVSDDRQYLRDLKETVLKGRINIYTPMGEIIALPEGSTGVDYAFAINPDHVRYLESININGETMPPTHVLHDGDSVDLVLLKNGMSNENRRMWLEKVKSVEAREGLRQSIKHTNTQHRNEEAKNLLQQELGKQKLPKVILHVHKLQDELAKKLQKKDFDEVMADLGTGLLSIGTVVDEYKEIIQSRSHWIFSVLAFFHLLPKSRVQNKDSQIIDIEIYADDRRGLIYDITKCIALRELNIAKFGVFALPKNTALYRISLEVKDFEEFSELFDSLLQIPSVTEVLRKK